MLKKATLICFLLGIILGPAYYIAVTQFSGEEVLDTTIYSRELQLSDLSRRTSIKGEGEWQTPVAVSLSPGDSPYRLLAEASTAATSRFTRHTIFTVVLEKGGKKIWEEPVDFRAKRKKQRPKFSSQHQTIKTFSVPEAGTYIINAGFSPDHDAELPVRELQIELRSGVKTPQKAIYVPGIGLLVISFIGLIILAKKKDGKTEARNTG